MTAPWYRVLLEPWRIAPHPNEAHKKITDSAAFSMLLEGRLYDYERRRELQPDLPPLDVPSADGATKEDDPERQLLRALLTYLVDPALSVESFLAASRGNDSPVDLRVAAKILQSLALAETGQIKESADALRDGRAIVNDSSDPLGAALVELHLGLRLGERGRWGEAIVHTERASSFMTSKDQLTRSLRIIGENNLWNFRTRSRLDGGPLPGIQKPLLPHAILREAQLRASALREAMKQRFEAEFSRPSRGGHSWSAVDEIDTGLWAALMHNELTASFGGTRAARMMLAQYRLTNKDAVPELAIPDGLTLLIRSGESKAVEMAAYTILQGGPLGPLSEALNRALSLERSWLTSQSVLSFLKVAGELLVPEASVPLVNELLETALSALEAAPHKRLFELLGHEPVDALAGLLPTIPKEHHEGLALGLLRLININSNFVLADSVLRCVRQLDWESITPTTSEVWLAHGREWIKIPDLERLGLHVLLELSKAGITRAKKALVDAFRSAPSLLTAVGLMELRNDEPELQHEAIELTKVRLSEVQEKASKREYGWGGMDPAHMFGVSLVSGDLPATDWNLLIDFLVDTDVMRDQKEGALELLSWYPERIPKLAKDTLISHKQDLLSPSRSFWGDPIATSPAALRLLGSIGGLTDEELLEAMVEWSQSAVPLTRLDALRLADLKELSDNPVVTTTIFALTYDANAEVRSVACTLLVGAAATVSGTYKNLYVKRAHELGNEDGVAVPWGFLRGVQQTSTGPGALQDDVRRLRDTHPSRRVRSLADRVLSGRSSNTGGNQDP